MKKVVQYAAAGIVTAVLIWAGVSPPVATTTGNAAGEAAAELYQEHGE